MTTLVVIPQFGGTAEVIAPFIEALARDTEVRVIEPPGFGDAPSPMGMPSIRALAHAVELEMDAARLGGIDLFGIALGGMVAQWVAIHGPKRVRRLVLASTVARGLDASLHKDLLLARGFRHSRENRSAWLAHEALAHADMSNGTSVERVVRDKARSRYDLVWLAAAAAGHDARKRLSEVPARTLVLSGADDTLVAPSAQARLLEYLVEAELEVMEGVGHDLTIAAPAACAARVLSFVRRR